MFYTVYQTTNLVNGKLYVGAHKTTDPDDSYLGSGTLIKAAVKKYGRASFKKEVLHVYSTMAEMLTKEAEIVTPEFVAREDTYNLKEGGRYGTLSPEARRKISEAGKVAQNRPEVRARNSRTVTAAMARPEVKKRHRKAVAASWTPERRAEARETILNEDPETTEKRVEGVRRSWASYTDEERQARIENTAAACRTEEYRDKMSRASKASLARPEVKKRHREAVQKAARKPEERARRSERMKAVHARPGEKERRGAAISRAHNTPEGKRKLARRRRRGESTEAWQARIARLD